DPDKALNAGVATSTKTKSPAPSLKRPEPWPQTGLRTSRECGGLEARKKLRFAVVAYVLTILLSLLAPVVAIALYFAIAVILIVPFRAVRASLGGQSP
ncbi:MAG: hypothetical protein ACLP62_13395, partial [Acidimicrobiales bacterium]